MLPHKPLINPPVGGDRNEQDLACLGLLVLLADVGVVLKHLVNEAKAKVLSAHQPIQFGFHLRRGNHFHGLGDLFDTSDGLHAVLNGLLVQRECSLDRRENLAVQSLG